MIHVLAGDRITIGRRPENTIQLDDHSVSAHHAELLAANGHYRLHDLGSTNLTTVGGQPVTDYDLREPVIVSFGTVECEYLPDGPPASAENVEFVPTRAEIEFLCRDNLDLQTKLAAMQKHIDILSSARLVRTAISGAGSSPEEQLRLLQERDRLRHENANLKLENSGLREDLVAKTRECEALRMAWETARAEVGVSPPEAAPATAVAAPPEVVPTPAKPVVSEPPRREEKAKETRDHRTIAGLLVRGPVLIKAFRESLAALSAPDAAVEPREKTLHHLEALVACFASVEDHPVQKILGGLEALLQEQKGPLGPSVIRTLDQAAALAALLIEPRHFRRAPNLSPPRALIVEDDPDVTSTITEALRLMEMQAVGCADASDALARLAADTFDLIVLDIGLPEVSGLALCTSLRELPEHRKTPVVFLTAANTLESRAQSSLNGGNEFVAKPFNVRELALKGATWAYRKQFSLLP